jgi:hypothetical protein
MILTKQYDHDTPEKVFGIIGSDNASNIALVLTGDSRRVFVPACERVLLWDLKTHEQVGQYIEEEQDVESSSKKKVREEAVVAVAASSNGKHLAVGHQM